MSGQKFYEIPVKESIENTENARTIVLDIPGDLKDKFNYRAGQYITVEVEISGEKHRRSYSISSAPREDAFAFTVKRVKGGRVSPFLVGGIGAGDTLTVSPPEGRFTMEFDAAEKRAHYFFAAGSGITPVISLIKDCLEHEPKSKVFLLYGNRAPETVMFGDELAEMAKRYEGQFFLNHCFSASGKGVFSRWFGKKGDGDPAFKGRIDGDKVDKFFDMHAGTKVEKHFFICGPGNMISTIDKHLQGLGIDSKYIHREYFTVDEADKKEVAGAVDAVAKVELNGEEFEIQIPSGKTILEALQDKGYDPPYSCTSGVCSTCMAKLSKGKVEMENCMALDDSEVEDGYILTCQSKPVSEKVELTYEV